LQSAVSDEADPVSWPTILRTTVLFRCDGNSHTGLGHASRSLGLAEALRESGHECVFLGKFETTACEWLEAAAMHFEIVEQDSWSVDDATAIVRRAGLNHTLGVVVDSYEVSGEYLHRVESDAAPVLLIDDFATLDHYECSAVLNFTARSSELTYPLGPHYFLGPNWFPARRALRDLRARGPRVVGEVRHVLVTSGSDDPNDIVLPAVQSLFTCDREISIHIVVGAAYAGSAELEKALSGFRGETAILSRLPDLAGELAWADLCIATAGLTKYEAAYIGVPSAVVAQNDGQARDAACFAAQGVAVNLGLAKDIDCDRFASEVGRLIHDSAMRASLQRSALAMFPADPAQKFASALIDEVFV
jgi:UDP-2,4-diacetamido-2,4,6-trideoxy-beta-L-altropyranose hydrolase